MSENPCDLFEEGAGLVDERVVLAESDAGGVHGHAAGQVGMLRAEDDLPVAGGAGVAVQVEPDLTVAVLVEPGGAVLAEHLEVQPVGVAGGDPGDLQRARAIRETGVVGGVVVVGDGLVGVADLGVVVPHDGTQRQRPLGDRRAQGAAGDLLDRAGQELAHVGQVAADVGQRAGALRALVAPAHRCGGAAAVVGPVAAGEVQRPAQLAGVDELLDERDTGRAQEGEPDAGQHIPLRGGVGRGGHRPGVRHGVGQRLLAQHVLAGGQQTLDHLAVQLVGDDDADHVDVVGLGDGLPGGVVALVPEAAGGQGAELGVHVPDGHQPDRRQDRVVDRARRAVGGRVGLAGHAGADDGDPDAVGHAFSFEVHRSGVPAVSKVGALQWSAPTE